MADRVNVFFAINAPQAMNRHRVSVWDDDGCRLSGPTAESTVEVSIGLGQTIHVEASVPSMPARKTPVARRDEGRWQLRAATDAHTVLNLGQERTVGTGNAIEIRVDGAA